MTGLVFVRYMVRAGCVENRWVLNNVYVTTDYPERYVDIIIMDTRPFLGYMCQNKINDDLFIISFDIGKYSGLSTSSLPSITLFDDVCVFANSIYCLIYRMEKI